MARKKAGTPEETTAVTPAKKPTTRKTTQKTETVVTEPEVASVTTDVGPVSRLKFTLYNFNAQPRGYYLVDRSGLPVSDSIPDKSVAHQIIIVDRSGSMWGAIEDVKRMLTELLTLEQYAEVDLIATLLSYSSEGDLQCHFQRTPISEIIPRDSRPRKGIDQIRCTGLTCVSQAVKLAMSLVKEGEMTAITLHSDGYANDPSPNSETKAIENITGELQGKDVFVNTIAYGNYADYRFLAKIANGVSGVCIKAGNIAEMYEALNQTAALLSGSIAPPLSIEMPTEYDYQLFLSHSAKKLNGIAGTLKICGLKPDDDALVYRYRKLTAAEYQSLTDVPEVQTHEAIMAFAKAQLAEGNLNTAKYALASSYNATLTEKHSRALTNSHISSMSVDLDQVLFDPAVVKSHEVLNHVRINHRISLLELARLLGQHRDQFLVNLSALKENYRRRGIKRVEGVRDEKGTVVKPWVKTEIVDKTEWRPVSSFDINRNTASMNMLFARKVRLVQVENGQPIEEVAGIKLDQLSIFNNYTLVSDGELNIPILHVKISSKGLFETLKKQDGLVEGEESYDAEAEYALRLEKLPLVPGFSSKLNFDGLFDTLAQIKVLTSILSAHLKEESADFTLEQVEELKKHYLSKSLYLSFPTTTEYSDLQQALNEGSVDARTSYKIDIGNRELLNMGKLMSGNKFLDRLYVTKVNGTELDKPAFDATLDGTTKYEFKKLSARTKVTKADEFMKRIFDDFLGLDSTGSVMSIVQKVGMASFIDTLNGWQAGKVKKDVFVAAMGDLKDKLESYADQLFEENLSPLVFYIGSTGLLPDEIDAKAQTAEALGTKYPALAFSKDEQEGMYFEIGETILGVYAKKEYFSM